MVFGQHHALLLMLLHIPHQSELVVTNEGKLLGTTELLKAVWALRQAAADLTADTVSGP